MLEIGLRFIQNRLQAEDFLRLYLDFFLLLRLHLLSQTHLLKIFFIHLVQHLLHFTLFAQESGLQLVDLLISALVRLSQLIIKRLLHLVLLILV